jgi:multidrug efflux pump subunit AcrB
MLLDSSERLHAGGESFETANAHAGHIRLRPILMTTFCTLFGLLPLALGLGAGADLQKPLALAVVGGWCCRCRSRCWRFVAYTPPSSE